MDKNDNRMGLAGLLQIILGFGTFAIVCSDMFGYKVPKSAVPYVAVVYIGLLIVYIYLFVQLRRAGAFDVKEKKENVKKNSKVKK